MGEAPIWRALKGYRWTPSKQRPMPHSRVSGPSCPVPWVWMIRNGHHGNNSVVHIMTVLLLSNFWLLLSYCFWCDWDGCCTEQGDTHTRLWPCYSDLQEEYLDEARILAELLPIISSSIIPLSHPQMPATILPWSSTDDISAMVPLLFIQGHQPFAHVAAAMPCRVVAAAISAAWDFHW